MHALVKPAAAPGMEMREVPVPSISATDVLVAVETASVCGTDLHIYHWDEWAQNRIKPPYIPGHEFSGIVAAVGELVDERQGGRFRFGGNACGLRTLFAVPQRSGPRMPVREDPGRGCGWGVCGLCARSGGEYLEAR